MTKRFPALRAYGAIVVSRNVLVLLVLLAMVQASALAVAYTTYRSRVLFSRLEAMRDDAAEMQVVWHQLLLEQSTLASFNRVVEVAQVHLGMKIPNPHAVVVLHNPDAN
jgi:cell division protein FtsL